MEKHKEHQVKKELEQQKQESKSALERVIEERARRLETVRNITEMDTGLMAVFASNASILIYSVCL
jgi:hypothetical protein